MLDNATAKLLLCLLTFTVSIGSPLIIARHSRDAEIGQQRAEKLTTGDDRRWDFIKLDASSPQVDQWAQVIEPAVRAPEPDGAWHERQWCEWIAKHRADLVGPGAVTEHVLPDRARVDIITASEAFEVDYSHKWAEGVGQALFYAASTGRRAGLVLLTLDDNSGRRDYLRALVVCSRHNIRLIVVKIPPKPEPQRAADPDAPVTKLSAESTPPTPRSTGSRSQHIGHGTS